MEEKEKATNIERYYYGEIYTEQWVLHSILDFIQVQGVVVA